MKNCTQTLSVVVDFSSDNEKICIICRNVQIYIILLNLKTKKVCKQLNLIKILCDCLAKGIHSKYIPPSKSFTIEQRMV